MAVDDVYQLTINCTMTSGIAQMTLHYIRTEEPDVTVTSFNAVAILMKDVHRAQQHTDVTYRSWRARQVRGPNVTWPSGSSCAPVGGNLFEGNFTTNTTGMQAGDMLPHQCAIVTTHKTGQIGRRHRGRTYGFGFSENFQAAGVWSGGLLSQVEAGWTALYGATAIAVPASGLRLGVWSFRTASGCVPNPSGAGHLRAESPNPAQAFTPVTSFLVRPTVYTQRRRVAGVGL